MHVQPTLQVLSGQQLNLPSHICCLLKAVFSQQLVSQSASTPVDEAADHVSSWYFIIETVYADDLVKGETRI